MCCPYEDINPTSQPLAITCLVLNVFFPGVGTLVNACLGERVAAGLLYGLLQILMAPLLIGWIWSIIYGVRIVEVSSKSHYYDGRYLHPYHHKHVYHQHLYEVGSAGGIGDRVTVVTPAPIVVQ
ncbi:hypothetical protein FGO68_gene1981 [Halteria grandinella]|uniref:Transmembrane protein n=1 Tax=Halteria grandinella TaxID=5974 RepID=A0A8J8NHF7_HALGN|nr:hypothetical protein FGO68_gene1981 [Halteria grandinella]